MSDDNIVTFPGVDPEKAKEKPVNATADEALLAALGRYDEVIIIGINASGGQCISSMPLRDAVYELSRAMHRIHEHME